MNIMTHGRREGLLKAILDDTKRPKSRREALDNLIYMSILNEDGSKSENYYPTEQTMQTKKFIFKFVAEPNGYVNEDTDDMLISEYSFDVTYEGDPLYDNDDKFEDEFEILQDVYGVHDCSFEQSKHIHGFTSYEVDPEKYMELMGKWKTFITSLGCKCGEINYSVQ
jgi:hypothetical protein